MSSETQRRAYWCCPNCQIRPGYRTPNKKGPYPKTMLRPCPPCSSRPWASFLGQGRYCDRSMDFEGHPALKMGVD